MSPAKLTEADFWDRTHEEDRGYDTSCLIYSGQLNQGYGVFRADGRDVKAHRYAYALAHPTFVLHSAVRGRTHEIDHLCRQRDCVRSSHLEEVTLAVNRQRMQDAIRTDRCKPGLHDRASNEKIDSLGRPFCGACARLADARRRDRKRAAQ